ncbi:peptidoglycan-binding domain-containing protein, partial [Streptomyces albus]
RTEAAPAAAPAPMAGTQARITAKCPYPYVCFTKGTTILSKYKDAGYWQTLGPQGRTADSAHNTRKDDVVYVSFSNAAKICMKPGQGWAFNGAHPREVFISTSSTCKGAGLTAAPAGDRGTARPAPLPAATARGAAPATSASTAAQAQCNWIRNSGLYCGFYYGESAVIGVGNQGKAVKEAQWLVEYWGNPGSLQRDGIYGPATKKAVVWFQKKMGLKADGIVGPKTWYALRTGIV